MPVLACNVCQRAQRGDPCPLLRPTRASLERKRSSVRAQLLLSGASAGDALQRCFDLASTDAQALRAGAVHAVLGVQALFAARLQGCGVFGL